MVALGTVPPLLRKPIPDMTTLPPLSFVARLLVAASSLAAIAIVATRATTATETIATRAAAPVIVAWYQLEEMPLPLPDDARAASRALAFRMGGISDLFSAPHPADGRVVLWAVTDRGPNGFVERPAIDGKPASPLRTLPLPEFRPLIVRLTLEEPTGEGPGIIQVSETLPIMAADGHPASGRPAIGPPRGKPMVDPTTALPLPIDPDGLDSEGLAPTGDGGFWLAEEYGPSLVRLSAEGRMVRRIVPVGMALDGAGCEVVAALPADYLRRQDNRGFESLTVAPDGSRMYAILQSPLETLTDEEDVGRAIVPLLVIDPSTGVPIAEFAYPLGAAGETADAVAAADGKISAVTASGTDRLLVLEQSTEASRIYEVDLDGATDTLPHRIPRDSEALRRAEPLAKRLVADLADLSPHFNSALNAGAEGPPTKLSDLKFEGLALLSPGVVAIINDNDFDMDAAGAAPASPAIRRTCLWVLGLGEAID